MKKIFFLIVFFLLVSLTSLRIYKIDGSSMIPALFPNDYVLVLKKNSFTSFTGLYKIRLDDIVLFTFKDSSGENVYIKRCIGLKTDSAKEIIQRLKIRIQKYKYYSDTYEKDLQNKSDLSRTDGYYLIGDNLIMSIDSRFFGKIKEENIFGKVILNIKLF